MKTNVLISSKLRGEIYFLSLNLVWGEPLLFLDLTKLLLLRLLTILYLLGDPLFGSTTWSRERNSLKNLNFLREAFSLKSI